ncbi:MAG: glycosyltransferase [Patescibacteria group bacterium]|nr:glycosyltransferase [Patescibacteria group bacterium]
MNPTIVVTGGGSGGHITPIMAVAAELKRQQPEARIIYIGQVGDGLADIPEQDPNIDEVFYVRAGKFRRYHGEGFKQLLDLKTVFLNIRDLFYIAIGLVQSFRLLRKLRPGVIFTRGGYVSVPVALGGKLQGIPYITHDSDSTPSLANRLIARWASLHAVALPEELYPYPPKKTVMVGVPVSSLYQVVTPTAQHRFKHELGLDQAKQILLVTGGGNGARQLNNAVINNAQYLLRRYPHLFIVHIAGRSLENEVNEGYERAVEESYRERISIEGFISNLHAFSGAADVVIARGGATNLAEFAIQGKACVIVPSKQLIWNVKNTEALVERHAVVQLTEDQAEQERRLASVLSDLFDNESKRLHLAQQLSDLARPDAAKHLAMLLLEQLPRTKKD